LVGSLKPATPLVSGATAKLATAPPATSYPHVVSGCSPFDTSA